MSVFWRPRGCVLWHDYATLSGDTAYDLSGYGNNGKLYGPSWKRGPLMGALSLDGVDDYVEVADDASLRPSSEITVEVLLKPTFELSERRDLLVKAEPGAGYAFISDPASTLRLKFWIVIAGVGQIVDLGYKIELDEWSMLDALFDGYTLKLYHNSELKDSLDVKGTINHSTARLAIGCHSALTRFYPAEVALVRIYNRALTEREIKAHYRYLKRWIVVPYR